MRRQVNVDDLASDLSGVKDKVFQKSDRISKDKLIESIYCKRTQSRDSSDLNEKSVKQYLASINKNRRS